MVYIHGGGFNGGSNTTKFLGPDYLLAADVVVVTINYRLGAFGFMTLDDESLRVSGNAALKDQRLALNFVKRNIENFGGDPGNVTLFGQSAGGCSVSWHCVSAGSKDLFNRAIIIGGCVLNKFSINTRKNWAFRLARKLGYNGCEEESEILGFLLQAKHEKIVEFQDTLLLPEERGKISMVFGPHVEPYITESTFIVKHPLELVRNAWGNDIDVLIGGTSDEGLMYQEYVRAAPELLKAVKLENMIPFEVPICKDEMVREKFVEKLRKIYYPLATDPTKDEMAFYKVMGGIYEWY